MGGLKNMLKILINTVQDMIDNDECNHIKDEDIDLISTLINGPRTMGREAAAKYLGINLNEFHKLRRDGIISKPKTIVGFKELHYYTSDLKRARIIIDSMTSNTR